VKPPRILLPRDVIQLAERGYQGIEGLLALAPRVIDLLDQAEQLIGRANALITRIDETNDRARNVVADTAVIVGESATVVRRAAALTDTVTPLVNAAQPALDRLLPLLNQVAKGVSAEDAAAITQLIQSLPVIVDKLDRDILPVLDTLGTVAPDMRELLDLSKDLNELLGSVPGFGRAKRRLDDEQHDGDHGREYLADEDPSTAPERRTSGPTATST
jgi:ABC-type transporter Mla subunit MlaD